MQHGGSRYLRVVVVVAVCLAGFVLWGLNRARTGDFLEPERHSICVACKEYDARSPNLVNGVRVPWPPESRARIARHGDECVVTAVFSGSYCYGTLSANGGQQQSHELTGSGVTTYRVRRVHGAWVAVGRSSSFTPTRVR